MKKQLVFAAVFAAAISPYAAYAESSGQVVDCDSRPVEGVTVHVEHPNGNVSNYVETDSNGIFSITCNDENDNLVFAKRGTNTRVVIPCRVGAFGYRVEFCCKPCSNCYSDAGWSPAGTGARKFTTKTCNCDGTCDVSTNYECYGGYYGYPSDSTPYCTACPAPGTSNAGRGSITRCYVPRGARGSDATGSFEYTGDCYYAN